MAGAADSGAPVLAALRRFAAGLDHPALAAFLRDWPAAPVPSRTLDPRGLPVLRWLDQALAAVAPRGREVGQALAAASARLAWAQTYSTNDLGARFLDRYGWTELLGQRGPVASDRLAVGLLILGPETEYPRHRHEAEELYLPLAGAAEWLRGDEGWARQPPGAIIHHPAWMPHGMRTGREPLLAAYLWRAGDLSQRPTLG